MEPKTDHLQKPITVFARKDFSVLQENFTVHEALDALRKQVIGERIIYFYVVDENGRLTGVLPTRRLLAAQPEKHLANLMVRSVLAIPHTATALEACEMFV